MGRKDTTRLVIDADVAQAAGNEDCVHPTGQRCREFLIAVRDNGLHIVMTPKIGEEWREHQSNFTRKWRVGMYAKKRIVHIRTTSNQPLLDRLRRVDTTDKGMAAMKKDWRLVEAALATDRTVASCDNTARGLFSKACGEIVELKVIVWVNPDRPEEEPIAWLEQGAPPDEHRKLGWKE